ncbi:unnamed protein product [Camellia sinensis]
MFISGMLSDCGENYDSKKIEILIKDEVLSDSETVRWLNHIVEKIWPVCMKHIASQKILLPVMPWFLRQYKPWTAYGAATAASKNSWEVYPSLEAIMNLTEEWTIVSMVMRQWLEERHSWAMCSNYEISAKSNYNFEKPFLYLARKLAGHEAELAAAASQPLPDDDDDAFD